MNIGIYDSNNREIKIGDEIEVVNWFKETIKSKVKIEMITVTGDDHNYVDVIGIETSDLWQYENTGKGLKAINVTVVS